MSNSDLLLELTSKAKRLVRQGKYMITRHALEDHLERQITAVDILEVLKLGSAVSLEPREQRHKINYSGHDRYRWFGEDQRDRVLRLIIAVHEQTVVISAAEATPNQAQHYRDEDQEGLVAEKDSND